MQWCGDTSGESIQWKSFSDAQRNQIDYRYVLVQTVQVVNERVQMQTVSKRQRWLGRRAAGNEVQVAIAET